MGGGRYAFLVPVDEGKIYIKADKNIEARKGLVNMFVPHTGCCTLVAIKDVTPQQTLLDELALAQLPGRRRLSRPATPFCGRRLIDRFIRESIRCQNSE